MRLPCCYRRYLERSPEESFTLIESGYGEETAAICHDKHPDILFLDHTLPDIDTLGLVKRLANSQDNLHMPIVVTIGDCLQASDIAANFLAAGACKCLIKEKITPTLLVDAIHQVANECAIG